VKTESIWFYAHIDPLHASGASQVDRRHHVAVRHLAVGEEQQLAARGVGEQGAYRRAQALHLLNVGETVTLVVKKNERFRLLRVAADGAAPVYSL
jgi:hypothetical protein